MNDETMYPEYVELRDYFSDPAGDAGDENAAGITKIERAKEFGLIMLLLVLKVSIFFVQQYCAEKNYDTSIIEIIQF